MISYRERIVKACSASMLRKHQQPTYQMLNRSSIMEARTHEQNETCPTVGEAVDLRELKALEIAARSKIAFDGKTWLVPSQSSGNRYKVTIGSEPSCECEASHFASNRANTSSLLDWFANAITAGRHLPSSLTAYRRGQHTRRTGPLTTSRSSSKNVACK